MSGVIALETSMDSSTSTGTASRAICRASPSGDGTSLPLKVTWVFAAEPPRIWMYRPSPWSRATATPGRRCTASGADASGKRPIWSEATTLVMFGAFFCRLSASAWFLAITPSTWTSVSCTTETGSSKSTPATARPLTVTSRDWA